MRTGHLDCLAKLSESARAAHTRGLQSEEACSSKKLFRMGLDARFRALPNCVASANLFALVEKGKELYLTKIPLLTRRGISITYSGIQLDEHHADAWMQLIFESRNTLLGQPVTINRSKFLKAIGRSNSGRDYLWLKETMLAFYSATLIIEVMSKDGDIKRVIGDHRVFRMLFDFDFSGSKDTYTFTIDPRWKLVFGDREYSLVDFQKRLAIKRGYNIAKAIQRFISTSADKKQNFELSLLKAKLNYKSPMNKFKKSLMLAKEELERVKVISGGAIQPLKNGKEYFVITRI